MSTEITVRPRMGLMPTTMESAMKMAEIFASSTMVPKDFQRNPGNCLVAIQWGAELGLAPLQAMQNIAVINGRPSVWGDAALALVRSSGLLESIDETVENGIAACRVKRRGESAVVRHFSMEDAKRAGLSGKSGPWQQYPERMLQMRARGFALRDVFPDVLRGMHIAEEAMDIPDEPVLSGEFRVEPEKKQDMIAEETLFEITSLIDEHDLDRDRILDWMQRASGATRFEDLTQQAASKVVQKVRSLAAEAYAKAASADANNDDLEF